MLHEAFHFNGVIALVSGASFTAKYLNQVASSKVVPSVRYFFAQLPSSVVFGYIMFFVTSWRGLDNDISLAMIIGAGYLGGDWLNKFIDMAANYYLPESNKPVGDRRKIRDRRSQ